ncbi:MAG: OsmC family protein, partial [Gemmatimonadetes bacterium]|nr:OsmC family protein [Gemmatimonadota bacterium]
VPIDGSHVVGGQGLGARPMELLLAGLGGCSAIDVVSILGKQREAITAMTVTVEADREPDVVPSLFTHIHCHFEIAGPVSAANVARAVELSMAKYCSAARILEKSANITWSHAVSSVPA